VPRTVNRPLSLVPSPVARLDARRNGSEWFVLNRRGILEALELAGFVVEAVTKTLRDHPGPAIPRSSIDLRGRLMYRSVRSSMATWFGLDCSGARHDHE
jgi:hypothetical protein